MQNQRAPLGEAASRILSGWSVQIRPSEERSSDHQGTNARTEQTPPSERYEFKRTVTLISLTSVTKPQETTRGWLEVAPNAEQPVRATKTLSIGRHVATTKFLLLSLHTPLFAHFKVLMPFKKRAQGIVWLILIIQLNKRQLEYHLNQKRCFSKH